MTEGLKPTNLADATPRSSGLNRADSSRLTGLSRFKVEIALATAGTLAFGGLGVAKAQSPQPSFEPGFSPTPTDVLTGELPCLTPEPSVAPERTEPPFPTQDPNIGHVGGEVVFAQGQNPNSGEIVVVTLAQEAPSIAPSIDPLASPTPNPETAVLDCVPLVPLEMADFELSSLINKGYEPMTKKQFIKAVKRNAPSILEHTKTTPELDTVEEIVAEYEYLVDTVNSDPSYKHAGAFLLESVVLNLEDAKLWATLYNSDIDNEELDAEDIQNAKMKARVANAYLDIADAERRLAQGEVDFDLKNPDDPKAVDKATDKELLRYSK